MLALTSPVPVVLAAVAALALPVVLVVTWRRRPRGVLGGALRLVVVLVCQALAVSAVALEANDVYGFYNWSEVLGGRSSLPPDATANTLVPRDGSQGRVVTLTVSRSGAVGPGAPHALTVLGWLPPQYDQPQYRDTRFPVLMMLPGQPGTPQGVMRQFGFAKQATAAIASGAVAPFVAIVPPLMVEPPRDTECTDVRVARRPRPGWPATYGRPPCTTCA